MLELLTLPLQQGRIVDLVDLYNLDHEKGHANPLRDALEVVDVDLKWGSSDHFPGLTCVMNKHVGTTVRRAVDNR